MAPIRRALAGSLQTRFTVLYATLFAAAMLLVSIAVYGAVTTNARSVVRGELEAGATVFDRLWTLRSDQLRSGAEVLSRDFGFRTAFATADEATIVSALENLRIRLGVDRAFVIGADGAVLAASGGTLGAETTIADALIADEDASGVVLIGGAPHQAISAPILSPDLAGWVVFASRLDTSQMKALERLSSIPLSATVFYGQKGAWTSADPNVRREGAALGKFIDRRLGSKNAEAADVRLTSGAAIAVVKPLASMDPRMPAVLVLRYPLATALAPYRGMLGLIAIVSLLGMIALVIGSWALARTLTRPITALDQAAHRLQAGEDVEVEEIANDEVGRLARSFNAMATEIRARERRISHLAHHDGDTGMPNRLAIERQLGTITLPEGHLAVVAACAIERFSEVRGAIGYSLAGRLVAELGGRLSSTGLFVGRLTTGALGVVFTASSLDEAQESAEQFRILLEKPVDIDGATVDISVTIGLAARPLHAARAGALIDRASIALDQARRARRPVAVFDRELYGDPAANLSLMSQMLEGLKTGALSVHYQPKYDLRHRKVTGVEALVRWMHPTRGPLSPELFVGMAEETGNIRSLTDFVLARAISDQRALIDAGHPLTMSVNISGRLLGDAEFNEAALVMTAERAGAICFEITETAVIENPQGALSFLDKLAEAGIEVSIDDYGSGLSSLAYLKRIKATELKIDREFIRDLAGSQRDALLVRSTIDMAHSLGLHVTAEGVEDSAVIAMLAVMGCDMAQGYAVGRPMPVNDLLRYLADSTVNDQLGGSETVGGGQALGDDGDVRHDRRNGARAV